MDRSAHRRFRLALILVLLAAFALRLYHLDGQSLWYDEGVTATVAQYDLGALTRWTADDIQPPLYYYVVAGWGRLAGWSEWSLRFPSAFFGTLLVPLLAALAYHLTRRRRVALAAALLTAAHPLAVYYSQEARMYMQLLALGVLAGILLKRGCRSLPPAGIRPSGSPGVWWAFVLTATAAAYTHYFAFFLLAALGLAVLVDHRADVRAAPRTWLGRLALSYLAIGLLYLPWAGTLFTQLRVDASYWEGALKLWEALRHVAIRFTLGETVLETQAVTWLAYLYAPLTAVALLRALILPCARAAGRYALIWLVVPVLGVLALAAWTPKFNARYAMVALPGLILLWSVGLAWPGATRPRRPATAHLTWHVGDTPADHPIPSPPDQPASRSLFVLLLFPLLAGFLYADHNWFTDPAFTKDQWRELTQYVRAHRSPDEAAVLVSGHTWPIWRYYAPDIPAVRLPPIEILDVNAVLDFGTGPTLAAGLTRRRGAWLVTWQDEVVDPMGVTPILLALAGREVPVEAGFWGLGLRHFVDLDPQAIPWEPPIQVPAEVRFGQDLHLLGHTVMDNGDLLLFWRLDAPTTADYRRTLETWTEDDLFVYHRPPDARLGAYTYPTFRWRPGQVTVSRIPARTWAGDGAAQGRYRVRVGVYDPQGDLAGLDAFDAAGRPLGKRAALTVDLPVSLPAVPEEDPTQVWHALVPGVYVDARLLVEEAAPGATVPVEIRWYAVQDRLVRHWFSVVSSSSARVDQVPLEGWMPLDLMLPQGGVVRTILPVRMPPVSQDNQFWIHIGVPESPGTALVLPISIVGPRRTGPPPVSWPVDAVFGEGLRLIGIDGLTSDNLERLLASSDTFRFDLVWQAEDSLDADLNVTVQWLGPDGRPAAQQDAPLARRGDPWPAGQVVRQAISLPVPPAPGTYTLLVAVYDPNTPGLPRLPLSGGGDALILGAWTVPERS